MTDSIFHKLVTKENSYTQLLCNMMKRDEGVRRTLLTLLAGGRTRSLHAAINFCIRLRNAIYLPPRPALYAALYPKSARTSATHVQKHWHAVVNRKSQQRVSCVSIVFQFIVNGCNGPIVQHLNDVWNHLIDVFLADRRRRGKAHRTVLVEIDAEAETVGEARKKHNS